MASQFTKLIVKESGIVDEETADTIGNVAEAVEKQADADRDASMTDRLKMAGLLRCASAEGLNFIYLQVEMLQG